MCLLTKEMKEQKMRPRRGKRDKKALEVVNTEPSPVSSKKPPTTRKRRSKALQKHGSDAPSGGIQSLLPSIIGLAILICGVMAKMGFRGRATVAGIDLGTTNSVICVQAPAKGVGEIDCIRDPATQSPIIPSVVSFLEASERPVGPSSKVPSLLDPHPSHVVVGHIAKRRIDSHPHHTLYNAKRVLGRPTSDPAIADLQAEVEFEVHPLHDGGGVAFGVPDSVHLITPDQVGSYVVSHLMQITKKFLGHDNIKSAVICVPAKFNNEQRIATHLAFQNAGISVARVVEEPTAAALAYGLHRKQGVDYILVYDFGGGTLDVSLLHVSDGFVDVMGSDGDDRLGGTDFDSAVAHVLMEQHSDAVSHVAKAIYHLAEAMKGVDLEEKLSAACPILAVTPLCTMSSLHTIGEQLKIGLSAYPNHDGSAQGECLGLPAEFDPENLSLEEFCYSLSPVSLGIKSKEYDNAVQTLYDRSILPVKRLLADLELKQEDIDEVVMVGGTTRMPQIRTLVREVLPSAQLNTHIDPDITVAYGAASVID